MSLPREATAKIICTYAHVYLDASGFPALVECAGFACSLNYRGGQICLTVLRAPRNASRGGRAIATDRITTAYAKMVEERTSEAWRAANHALYSPSATETPA